MLSKPRPSKRSENFLRCCNSQRDLESNQIGQKDLRRTWDSLHTGRLQDGDGTLIHSSHKDNVQVRGPGLETVRKRTKPYGRERRETQQQRCDAGHCRANAAVTASWEHVNRSIQPQLSLAQRALRECDLHYCVILACEEVRASGQQLPDLPSNMRRGDWKLLKTGCEPAHSRSG